jgi:fructose-specific PTS system IIA-like component
MPLEHHFVCPLPNGTHARPASALEEVARGFRSDITLVNRRTGQRANAKNVLAIVGADVRYQDPCLLQVEGPDERSAMPALVTFLRDHFDRCDKPIPEARPAGGELMLPPMLRHAGGGVCPGTPLVAGIGRGRIVRAGGFRLPADLPVNGVVDRAGEQRRLEQALDELIARYGQRLADLPPGVEREVLAAHRAMARDLEFRQRLLAAVQQGSTAAGAIMEAEAHFSARLAASNNPLLAERRLDVQDICRELLQQVYGSAARGTDLVLTGESIVVADSLTPGQFLALNRQWLRGLVLAQAGATSHTVILARSFCIPTLAGVNLAGLEGEGREVVVDADLGGLVTALPPSVHRYYELEQTRLAALGRRLRQFAAQPAVTADGTRLEISANIGIAGEADLAFGAGAEGIGLFRTEMLFLDRATPPGEDEQYEVYRHALVAAGHRPVVVRTLDAGGDKPLPYLPLPAGDNPFLGYRAVRIYPEFEVLFRTQIRALVRASAHGTLSVMVPMIATVEEVRWCKKIIAEEQARCAAGRVPFDAAMPVGGMIEVPSAVLLLEELCEELDFFSIGSNDLLQYFMAADRLNPRVAALYDPLQPAFLRLLLQIVEATGARNKPLSLCGEMASHRRYLPLLVGAGIKKISVASPAIAGLKAELAKLRQGDCRRLFALAHESDTAAAVANHLATFPVQQAAPLIRPELVADGVVAATKAEAIKQVVDLLNISGRTDHPRAVEAAVWAREATYSTGFGHGCAIPHCKTDAVQVNSLAVLRLAQGVEWGSLDGQPVRLVILLVMRESEAVSAHMKVFARLARKLMHEPFRAWLAQEKDPDVLCALLREVLET